MSTFDEIVAAILAALDAQHLYGKLSEQGIHIDGWLDPSHFRCSLKSEGCEAELTLKAKGHWVVGEVSILEKHEPVYYYGKA